MTHDKEMMSWVVCGRAVGRASGWDQAEMFALMLYDFEPVAEFFGPSGDVLFRFDNGTIESFNNDGIVDVSVDLIDAIKDLKIERLP